MKIKTILAGILAVSLIGCLTDNKKTEKSPPTITSDPVSVTVNEGGTVMFVVAASGSGTLAYQWIDGESTKVAGGTKDTLTLLSVAFADAGSLFRCVVKNDAGADTSAAATLRVNSSAPKITVQPTDQTVALGGTVTFTVAATGTGTLTYKWVVNNDTVSGLDNARLSGVPSALDDGASIKCIVTDNKGSVTSNTVILHITGLTTWPTEETISVGAQGNPTLGTAIDLDVPQAMLAATANTRQGDIDLLFAFTNAGSADSVYQIMSPVAAKAAGVSVAVNYNSSLIQDIRFVKVASKPANQQAAVEIFNDSPDLNSSEVAAGDMFIVNTTDGNYVYLKVDAITSDRKTGSAALVVSVGTI